MRRSVLVSALMIPMLASVRTLPAQTPEPLSQLVAAFEEHFNAGDGAAVAALYTSDAIRIPPEEPLVRGPAEIEASMAQFGDWTIELKTMGGLLEGDVGTSWGTYKLLGMVEGAPATIEGRWMNALKKTDAGWRIHRDIWNLAPPE